MKLAIQTLLLPGKTLDAKFENAARYGFDGIELAIGPSFDLIERFDDVQRAISSSGLPVCAICTHPMHDPFAPEPAERKRRFDALTTIMQVASALGAGGVVSVPFRTPHAFPGPVWPAMRDEVAEAYGFWAASLPDDVSAAIYLEPLNRYEASFLNRLDQATELCEQVQSPRVKLLGDLFHMNIEEASITHALVSSHRWLGLVHIADNNRFEPGAGCMDFAAGFAALTSIGYDGYVSIECWSPRGPELSGDPAIVLPRSVSLMRALIADAC